MFLEKINETKKTLAKYKSRQESIYGSKQYVQSLDIVNKAIQELISQIEISVATSEILFQEAGLSTDKKQELKSRLIQLRDDVEEREDVGDSGQKLKTFVSEYKKTENDKWRCAVEDRANSSISLLMQLGKFSDKADDVSNIVSTLRLNASIMPTTKDAVIQYAKALKYASNITNSVSGSDNVMAFLQRVSNNEATVSELNDEIWKWIKEHHMEQKLKISL
ncbi:hypothetical protein JRC49_10950 [Clostridiales bacterium FE2011]|nr:hypothetical protein JRC49_10950 [Clostridiales bacterium FE2011]